MINQEDLINKVKSYNKFLNLETLSKAYNFALKAHANQQRISGDPYLIHPVAVADILTDLKLDSATIATGLLHDTIEDTKATYETVKNEFGKEVADLVEGVTKISELEDKAKKNSKAENFRKLILATSKDIRVLLVKIADRLHNMRTIEGFKDIEKRKKIAKETMEIYAPLTDRMGMNRIRDELEDISFKVLNPEARELITERLKVKKENRKDTFKEIDRNNFNKINAQAGLNFLEVVENLLGIIPPQINIPINIQKLVDKRLHAKKQKNWKEADLIRQKLFDLGWKIEDTSDGTMCKPTLSRPTK